MDISDAVTTDFVEFTPETTVSKLMGTFEDPSIVGVLVRGDQFEGVVTRRQLATSQHSPETKLGSLVWSVPRIAPDEDVRRVARLMLDADVRLLPVFEGKSLVGVVTVDGILRLVEPHLDAVRVRDVYSDELVSVSSDASFGEALHRLREHRITHLPVVEDHAAVGILSLYDVTPLTVRSIPQSKGGDAGGTDAFGGALDDSAGRSRRGGFGAREGELDRILDLPVRDVMVTPVETIDADEPLDVAVEAMFEIGASSLVVTDGGRPDGIVTKSDVLESLTMEAAGNRAVQLYGADLLDDISYDDVIEMVEKFDRMDGKTSVLDAKIHLHEHDERLRDTPLLLARIRLHTDNGLYVATGEGYGAKHAINEARDVLERRIREEKTRGRSKKPPDAAFWEKRFGWWLEG